MVSKPKLYLIGGGGHALSVLCALIEGNQEVAGIIGEPSKLMEQLVREEKLAVYKDDNEFFSHVKPTAAAVHCAVGSVDTNVAKRAEICGMYETRGYRFASIVARGAIVANGVEIGEGTFVGLGATLNVGTIVGRNCLINTGAILEHECRVGEFTHIATGAVLGGGVIVGESVHFGLGARAIQGVKIGNGALVAAGAVVTRDVTPGIRVQGVPAVEYKA